MKNRIRLYSFLLAACSAVVFAGCSSAGETGAEVEALRGEKQTESSTPALEAEQALEKAQSFMETVAPGVFTVSLDDSGALEKDGRSYYLLKLVLNGAAYEPALAVDMANGILYSCYADGSLTPAAEDEYWTNFDASQASMTPEEQQNLAEAESFASEVVEEGTADYVLSMKTGRYVYADTNAIYIGYEGETYQTLFHDGLEGITPDETTLLARDVNFDGNDDIMLMYASGTVNSYYYLWLFDPAEGTYYPCPDFSRFSSPAISASTQRITTYQRDSAIDYTQEVWKWDDAGTLTKVSSYSVAEDENSQVTISSLDESGGETSFTVTEDEYTTAVDLMNGKLVDFCINRYGGSEKRSFSFEGMTAAQDISCYNFLMREGGEPAVRIFVDESNINMAMLDSDCDGTPEETVNMSE